MCISLFSYGRPVVRCMWVGSWVHKFIWQWVGLGWVSYLVGWVDENRPVDNSEPITIHCAAKLSAHVLKLFYRDFLPV